MINDTLLNQMISNIITNDKKLYPQRPTNRKNRPYGYQSTSSGRLKAVIVINGISIYIGTYDTATEAGKAHDKVYKEWWG